MVPSEGCWQGLEPLLQGCQRVLYKSMVVNARCSVLHHYTLCTPEYGYGYNWILLILYLIFHPYTKHPYSANNMTSNEMYCVIHTKFLSSSSSIWRESANTDFDIYSKHEPIPPLHHCTSIYQCPFLKKKYVWSKKKGFINDRERKGDRLTWNIR